MSIIFRFNKNLYLWLRIAYINGIRYDVGILDFLSTWKTFIRYYILNCFCKFKAFCGGLHASTYLRCFILSNLIFLSVYSLSWGLTYVSWFLSVLLLLISFIVIFAFAPIKNVNHPLSDERYIRNKRISRVLVFTEMIVILAIYTIIRNIYFLSIASTSMFAVSFMMLIPKICQARRVRYE